MQNKTLTKLGLLALVLLGIGLTQRESQGPQKAEVTGDAALLPLLADSLNEVASITISSTSETWSVSKSERGWGLDAKGGYPVKMEEVRKTLIALSEAEKIEAKTKVAANYPRLGVEGPGKEDSESKLVSLTDANGGAIAAVIVGNRRAGAGDPSFYVRVADSDQSWLVSGDLTLSEDAGAWLDKQILELPRERIQAVKTLHPDMEEVFVARPSEDVEQYEIYNIPEGSEPKYDAVAAGMGSALQYLNFVDVRSAEGFEFPDETPTTTSLWTFDGLLVIVVIYSVAEVPETETFYAAFSFADGSDGPEQLKAAGPEPAPAEDAEETPARSAEEIAAEVTELNAKLSGWIFEIAPFSKTNLAKRMEDLVQPIVVEEEAPATGAPQDGAPLFEGGLPGGLQLPDGLFEGGLPGGLQLPDGLFEGGLPGGLQLPDGLNIPVVEEAKPTEDGR